MGKGAWGRNRPGVCVCAWEEGGRLMEVRRREERGREGRVGERCVVGVLIIQMEGEDNLTAIRFSLGRDAISPP